MHIDTSHFPRVWVSSVGSSNWESELDGLLHQGDRFVLLTREVPGKGQEAAQEERKRAVLWLKRNRERLKQVCAGSIVVVTNPTVALSLRVALAPLGKAFGYPVRVVAENSIDIEINSLLECS
ncbi:hypothetical protein HOP51_15395 [Halomonas sp. MCCC 1A11036]|uniref:Uncharacterized protein n=1 Tax=Billgrantia zhangzhouensis TaxID=2733481 RepID=A0ABS9AIA8_9GAMM|nr:hypothetical protein [Halomonas zhangzhouensis]MCE8021484.1 hypothetical protein [Halomonas zhangzhouensis]